MSAHEQTAQSSRAAGQARTGLVERATSGQVLREKHVDRKFVVAIYGIPGAQRRIRDNIRWACKSNGLWSIDVGGSVYLGLRSADLDDALDKQLQILQRETGIANELVHFVLGDYDAATQKLLDDALFGELDHVETAIGWLEEVLASEEVAKGATTVKNEDGKKVELETGGQGRLNNAFKQLDGMDAAAQRFMTADLQETGEKLARRVRQVRLWVERVNKSFDRWEAGLASRVKSGGAAA